MSGLRSGDPQPSPRITCNECDGRGWHIGECYPREECSGCAGTGDLLSDESLASMVKDFETCKPKYEQNAVEKREMAREILRLRAENTDLGAQLAMAKHMLGLRPSDPQPAPNVLRELWPVVGAHLDDIEYLVTAREPHMRKHVMQELAKLRKLLDPITKR